jgi:hypothetical protein
MRKVYHKLVFLDKLFFQERYRAANKSFSKHSSGICSASWTVYPQTFPHSREGIIALLENQIIHPHILHAVAITSTEAHAFSLLTTTKQDCICLDIEGTDEYAIGDFSRIEGVGAIQQLREFLNSQAIVDFLTKWEGQKDPK